MCDSTYVYVCVKICVYMCVGDMIIFSWLHANELPMFCWILTNFRFRKFLALLIGPIFSKGHAKIYFEIVRLILLPRLCRQSWSEWAKGSWPDIYNPWRKDMIQNNETDIRCLCRKCKQKCLMKPFDGHLKVHLLMSGFMYGYTRWDTSRWWEHRRWVCAWGR
jgi:hypothetical protein